MTDTVVDYGKMDPEAKKLWVDALRSGKYEQGSSLDRLSIITGQHTNCCLGVLCHVLDVPQTDVRDFANDAFFIFNVNGKITQNWARVPEGFMNMTNNAIEECINMNDTKGMIFPEIADWIEENL